MLTPPLRSARFVFAATAFILSVTAHAATTAVSAVGGGWFSHVGEEGKLDCVAGTY